MAEGMNLRTQRVEDPDPYRVEIKESASGAVQVSVRATARDSDEAVGVAVTMYKQTRRELGLDVGNP